MKIFKNLMVNGRPACGKSEFIAFMKKISDDERIKRFHIGKFEEIDDFPWLWEIFEEDNRREANGEKRLYTKKTPECFNLLIPNFRETLIDKFNDSISKKYLSNSKFYDNGTLLIEFARGKADGFETCLKKFKKEILETSAIFHIQVSFDESYRRNNARYEAAKKSSILFHKVPDQDMYEYFIENDWTKITDNKPFGHLELNGVKVPFVTMNNEPELPAGPEIALRYEKALGKLYELYESR